MTNEMQAAPDLLKRIRTLGEKQTRLEADVLSLQEQLTDKNKELEAIRGGYQNEGELPQAMAEAELTEFTLENGATIKVAQEIKPPSMAANSPQREPMVNWLETHNQGGAVKNSITILFTKGDERVPKVEESLKALGTPYDKFATVHPSTLKSLLTEMLEGGEEVPTEELGIMIFKQSKVK